MENNAYFNELSRILRKHDNENGSVENGLLLGAIRINSIQFIVVFPKT